LQERNHAVADDLELLDREAERIVQGIGIPPCPAILTKLVQEMRQDDVDFPKIGRLISADVALAAAMLKTVNSPFFGLRAKATSVPQALVLLGLRNVAQIVTGLLLRQAFPITKSHVIEEFWTSSASIALVAARLTGTIKGINRDDGYTFALFRDCGIPLMANKFPNYHATQLAAEQELLKSIIEIELERYSIDHARVGRQLAVSWQLPEQTCQAILHHHDYAALSAGELPAQSGRLIALALVAECLYARQTTGNDCPEWNEGGAAALELLDIDDDTLAECAEEIKTLLGRK
jgi:HD-like signal output (HDOD) protein